MHINNKEEFKQYILSSLGEPHIKVNVTGEQLDYKVSDALQEYQEYHHDATERIIVKYEVTQTDIDNGFIGTLEDTIGIDEVWYDPSSDLIGGFMGIYTRELWEQVRDSSGGGFTSYINAEQTLNQMEDLFNKRINWQFNKHSNKLRLQVDWELMNPGEFVVYEAIRIVNPDTNSDIWNDRWLKEYATQMVKHQWGTNLSKFDNVELPGGMTVNGQTIKDEATGRISEMKEEMLSKYSFAGDIYLG